VAYLQRNFLKFHDIIRLREGDENANLREKRNTLVNALSAGIEAYNEARDEKIQFTHFNQGSYAMGTGTVPKDGNYDIDVGIEFQHPKDKFESSVALKKIVRDAIETKNRTVNIRRPCVTVNYIKNGETDYHVDLAIYAQTGGNELDLAMGREHSSEDQIYWQQSDPKGLIDVIGNRHTGDDAKQFRRCIRYLKKWRDQRFSGSGSPISIGLTCAAYHHFEPSKDAGEYSDLRAMKAMVSAMISSAEISGDRLSVSLPVRPWNDLFSEMTEIQMENFVDKLRDLKTAVDDAQSEASVKGACEILRKQFGVDFEVPEDDPGNSKGPGGTAKTSSTAPFIHSGTSALC